jgi:hypothetical protein
MSCSFPVCPSSPPSCILEAFQQSGYFSLLNSQQQAAAQSDPVGWLNSHPYLYSAYPQYFNATCGAPVTPGRPPDYLVSGGNYDYLIQQNAVQTATQINQNPQSNPNWWEQVLKYAYAGFSLGPTLLQSLYMQQNSPPQGSPNNPPPPPQIPQGNGYPNTGGQVPDWLRPFEDFGGWLLAVGKGINDFLNTLGNVYTAAVTVSGEHPLGVVMLIVFFLAIALLLFLPKL